MLDQLKLTPSLPCAHRLLLAGEHASFSGYGRDRGCEDTGKTLARRNPILACVLSIGPTYSTGNRHPGQRSYRECQCSRCAARLTRWRPASPLPQFAVPHMFALTRVCSRLALVAPGDLLCHSG